MLREEDPHEDQPLAASSLQTEPEHPEKADTGPLWIEDKRSVLPSVRALRQRRDPVSILSVFNQAKSGMHGIRCLVEKNMLGTGGGEEIASFLLRNGALP